MSKADRERRYYQTEKGKETNKRKVRKYRQTEKGKKVNNTVTRKWQINNPDRKKAIDKKYRNSEHGKEMYRIKQQKYISRKKNLPATLTINEWKEILENQGNKCNICFISFGEVRPTQDHIIPVMPLPCTRKSGERKNNHGNKKFTQGKARKNHDQDCNVHD